MVRVKNKKRQDNEEWSFEEEIGRALEESEEYTNNNEVSEKTDTREWEEREKDLIEFVEYIFGVSEGNKDGGED
jgi:hypothetical protein